MKKGKPSKATKPSLDEHLIAKIEQEEDIYRKQMQKRFAIRGDQYRPKYDTGEEIE